MKFKSGDVASIIGAAILFAFYLVSKNVFMLLGSIMIIIGFLIDKSTKISYYKQVLLGLVLGSVALLIYGFIEDEFWDLFQVVLGVVPLFYGIIECTYLFMAKQVKSTDIENYQKLGIKNYQKRATLAVVSLILGLVLSVYFLYKGRTERGLPLWESQQEFEMRKMKEKAQK